MSPARSASPTRSAPATPSSPSLPIMARATNRSCSTPISSAPRVCRYPHGSTARITPSRTSWRSNRPSHHIDSHWFLLCRRRFLTLHNHRTGEVIMTLRIGSQAPDFTADSTQGPIHFHEWLGDSWGVLFSHPKDFTPVCTTELGYMAKIKPEFDRRNVKIIGLSVDPTDKHSKWAEDIEETQGHAPNYPIIGDADFKVSKLYGMLPTSVSGEAKDRTAADNQTVRNVFVVGPDKKVKLVLVYPMTTGRNFDEVLRVIDSLQLTAKHKVATPVNWKQGEDVIIAGSVSDDDAKKTYPQGWKAPKPYLRIVPQPR